MRCVVFLSTVVFSLTGLSGKPWIASPEVIPSSQNTSRQTLEGIVFEDLNGDGCHQEQEPGIAGVKVSNGLEVVLTDDEGRYALPVRSDMDVSVIKPADYEVPVDARMVPQFAYVHKEYGSPDPLRFGGLEPTGPAPKAVNFPLRGKAEKSRFHAAVIGDSQTYSNTEVGYFRDSAITDIVSSSENIPDFLLYVGDVVGDDLGLLDRLLRVGSVARRPQWLVHGNHDLDFDAKTDADSSDSWRRIYGPNYYAFEEGDALFVILDNVVYPCGEEDMQRPGRDFCGDGKNPSYNGRIPFEQMVWLENLLELTPEDKLIVFAHHIPFVSFADPETTKHQTDNLSDLYKRVEGRKALSLSGHTHTLENHAPGEMFEGWDKAVGIEKLAFRKIIAGATSGSWYNGDFNYRGVPMSFQRLGAPKGVLMLAFNGPDYRESYLPAGVPPNQTMWTDLNTPRFRSWYETLTAWMAETSRAERENGRPPVSINDLTDNRIVTVGELGEGVWLTANVWAGSSETTVEVSINGDSWQPMERTQSGSGESVKVGAEWTDPFAAKRQLSVSRFALNSDSGEERAQGVEVFKGSRFGPAAPQPMGRLADRNMHLWRFPLDEEMETGVYLAHIRSTDRHGDTSSRKLIFEVVEELPEMRWRHHLWD